ncbi:MAG: pyridoxal-phosphate dependent enzyme [Polyangiaceae bacterium]|nr:pyridoxal-phosphate dependent enzyme [Polyangiaceae bacterium]
MDLPIFEVAPKLARRPFLPIAARPTPVEGAPSLGDRIWVKRDDLVSPRYGGNKVRRWEWLLGAAKDRGVETLVTVGGLGSTQVTSLTVHGTDAGFEVVAVLFDQPASAFVDEALMLDHQFGGRPIVAGGYVRTAIQTLSVLRRTKRSLFVPPGASSPLLNVAYVDALLELSKQVERGEAPRPDRIVVPCGSGGTAVGLAVGAAILGWPTRVEAVRITELVVSNPLTLAALTYATERLLRREGLSTPRKLDVKLHMDHRFVGEGYGHATPAAETGAERFTRAFGAAGEITYSGKAVAALDVIAREHPDEQILLWNTLSTTGRPVV